MITVTITGTKPGKLLEIVQGVYENTLSGLESIAYDTRNHMRDIISAGYQGKRSGSNGKLEYAIDVDKLSESKFGVGNISTLNVNVPYWGLLNSGGMVALKARRVPGYFNSPNPAPDEKYAGTGVGKDQFIYSPRGQASYATPGIGGSKTYMMVVKNPIGAVNYVEKTKDWLKTIMIMRFQSWTKTKKYKK